MTTALMDARSLHLISGVAARSVSGVATRSPERAHETTAELFHRRLCRRFPATPDLDGTVIDS